jgi:hypothetical protein
VPGRQRLRQYRWSSYPWYLSRQCPAWLKRESVLASLRLPPGARRGYEAYIESRVLELGLASGRKELEQSWKAIRRGWYLGGEPFLAGLEEWLEKAVTGRQRESQNGARKGHDEAAAERRLRAGLKALELTGEQLAQLGKGAPEKVALAWWLRRCTTVTLRWIGQRLAMGHYTRVTQAVSRMERKPGRKLRHLRARLQSLKS